MKRIFTMTQLGAAVALAFCTASPVSAKEVASPQEARVELARDLASAIQNPGFAATVRKHLINKQPRIADVLNEYVDKAREEGTADTVTDMRDLDRQAIRLRGLSGQMGSLASLRMHGGGELGELAPVETLLTAAISNDPSTGEKRLVTFDKQGNSQSYTLANAPDVPMIVVETDGRAAMQAGMSVINHALGNQGSVAGAGLTEDPGTEADEPATRQTEELTLLKQIYLTVDHEPDIQGDAEVFALVSGIDKEGKAHVVVKDMPWLDRDKRWYPTDPNASANQDLINWGEFNGNYVNVQFFEDDGDTNFQKLAQSLLDAIGATAMIVAPEAPPAAIVAAIAKVGDKLIGALDSKWFTNSTDYIDSIYLIERGNNYGTKEKPLMGMRGEVMMVLEPYEVK